MMRWRMRYWMGRRVISMTGVMGGLVCIQKYGMALAIVHV
jgi:hypothetical protein